jgi:tetratricopeptide (TPR) repeat protein
LDVAARCYERAYEITRFQQGEIDSNTASCAAHLAVVLANEGQTDRAEEYCHRVLTITRQLPRVDNPNTWKALDVLAEILRQKKQYEEAEAIYRKILTRRKEQLGLNHPSTAMTLGRLGLIRIFQGDTINGITMCQQSLEICLQTVGPDHPYTIEIQKIFDALPPRPSASN